MPFKTKNRTQPSYSSAYTPLKKVDSLAIGADWKCEVFKVTEDSDGSGREPEEEQLELWY
jgi:hypothetical protein